MKIGMAARTFKHGDVAYNLNVIKETVQANKHSDIDMLFFGEAFLQGFDALSWDFDKDQSIALSLKASEIDQLRVFATSCGIGLGVGYYELADGKIYSSYVVIDSQGEVLCNYRRYTKGWKAEVCDDPRYSEGSELGAFAYKGKRFVVGLCGDFWETRYDYMVMASRADKDMVIWPVFVDYVPKEWKNELASYAKQVNIVGDAAVMVNSIAMQPRSYGPAAYFKSGYVLNTTNYDKEALLVVEV